MIDGCISDTISEGIGFCVVNVEESILILILTIDISNFAFAVMQHILPAEQVEAKLILVQVEFPYQYGAQVVDIPVAVDAELAVLKEEEMG